MDKETTFNEIFSPDLTIYTASLLPEKDRISLAKTSKDGREAVTRVREVAFRLFKRDNTVDRNHPEFQAFVRSSIGQALAPLWYSLKTYAPETFQFLGEEKIFQKLWVKGECYLQTDSIGKSRVWRLTAQLIPSSADANKRGCLLTSEHEGKIHIFKFTNSSQTYLELYSNREHFFSKQEFILDNILLGTSEQPLPLACKNTLEFNQSKPKPVERSGDEFVYSNEAIQQIQTYMGWYSLPKFPAETAARWQTAFNFWK